MLQTELSNGVGLDRRRVAKWTAPEIEMLRRMADQHALVRDIVAAIGRSPSSVRQKADALGLPLKLTGQHWRQDPTDVLRRMAAEGASARQIGVVLNVSRMAVIGRAYRLNIALTAKAPGGSCPKSGASKSLPIVKTPRRLVPKNAESRPVSIWNVSMFQCRFPLTEVLPIEEFRFCGAETAMPFGYCDHHRLRIVSRRRA
jgi:GcrA cell cycle regulator